MFKIKPMIDIIPYVRTPKNSNPTIPIPEIIPTLRKKKIIKPKPKRKIIRGLAKPKIRRNNVMFKGKDYDVKPPHNIKKIAHILNSAGGRCYIVGGYVRDILLDKKPKDVDLEVHGMLIDDIASILRHNGYRVDEVGKST
jgi:hypothetical protein